MIELESTANKVHNSSLTLFKTLEKPSKVLIQNAIFGRQLC